MADLPTKNEKGRSDSPMGEVEHRDRASASSSKSPQETYTNADGDLDRQRHNASAKAQNPLAGYNREQLGTMGEEYSKKHGFSDEEDIRAFRIGAQIAGDLNGWDTISDLTDGERTNLMKETTHKWSNPGTLYGVILVCSLCAAVQGMDETVINGAQIFYSPAFGIGDKNSMRDSWLVGLVNSAPYLCCAVLGCWLTEPMNKRLGRRGTVWVACFISALACFWQAFTNTWYAMFIARFALGLGIGPKSATTPMFAAECAPPRLRGALVMCWQMFTAFGIMFGFIADLAFYFVPDHGIELGLNWRLMMGSAGIPAVIVCCIIPFYPESPRWYLTKNRHADAYKSICKMRWDKVQAARDLFYMQTLLEAESEAMAIGKSGKLKEMVSIRRNRNAVLASEIVMFMQQFCGVNVIAYYSSQIFLDANLSEVSALGASLGWGVVNFLFALPAFFTIDTFGRRNLLLFTFPFLAASMFFTGFSFWIPDSSTAHIACIALGLYLFGIFYSPGMGPVPFTYSAEAYPLYIRPIGMSLATATTWFFNFVLSITFPSLLTAFKPQGAFAWYGAWNVVGFFLVLFFVPETKEKTLEELDSVFDVSIGAQIRYGVKSLGWFVQRHVFFRKSAVKPTVPHHYLGENSSESYADEKSVDPTKRV